MKTCSGTKAQSELLPPATSDGHTPAAGVAQSRPTYDSHKWPGTGLRGPVPRRWIPPARRPEAAAATTRATFPRGRGGAGVCVSPGPRPPRRTPTCTERPSPRPGPARSPGPPRAAAAAGAAAAAAETGARRAARRAQVPAERPASRVAWGSRRLARSRPSLGHSRAARAGAKLQREPESESPSLGVGRAWGGGSAARRRSAAVPDRHVSGDIPPLPRLPSRDVLIQVISAHPRVT